MRKEFQKELPMRIDGCTKEQLEGVGFRFGNKDELSGYIQANLPEGWKIIYPYSDKLDSSVLYEADGKYFPNNCYIIDEKGNQRAILKNNYLDWDEMRFNCRYCAMDYIQAIPSEEPGFNEYIICYSLEDVQNESKAVYSMQKSFVANAKIYASLFERFSARLYAEFIGTVMKNYPNLFDPLKYWG